MENNNGKGIFYGVIGVATLVVAIIGATFAFFSATANNVGTVAGTAASANLSLAVTQESAGTAVMVPQKETTLATAMAGTDGETCVDGNGSTVCKVYKVVVTNDSTAAISVSGTIEITGGTWANLKINKTTIGTTTVTEVGDNGTFATGAVGTLGLGTSVPANAVNGAITLANTDASVTIPAGGTYSTFFVVWIDETGESQNATDTGTFSGTVAFESATGSGVTSTFTS